MDLRKSSGYATRAQYCLIWRGGGGNGEICSRSGTALRNIFVVSPRQTVSFLQALERFWAAKYALREFVVSEGEKPSGDWLEQVIADKTALDGSVRRFSSRIGAEEKKK